MFDPFDISQLNPAQRRAVEFPLDPLLVLAGPGTGKTRTLVCRVLHLIKHCQLKPAQILAVTYTNKATEEMRQRFREALGDTARQLTVGTFHGFCIRVLRDHYELVKLPKHFTIADEEIQWQVLARVVPRLTVDHRERHLRLLLGRLSSARLNQEEANRPLSNFEKQVLKAYQQELRRNCLIDFDDILFLTHQLLFEHPTILQLYRDAIAALLIDEFQDTDRVQYDIVKLLAAEHRNVFAVADDDQSIFSWRGANPSNIKRFLTDFAGANQIQLEHNYRSTGEIVTQAGALIAHNQRLAVKRLMPLAAAGTPIRFERFANETEEAAFLMREIRQTLEHYPDLRFGDFAVLYAQHKVGENLEQEFMKVGLPCQLVRGKSILEHDEIARALLLLRLICNPQDQITLENFCQRELSDVTWARLKELQDREQLPSFRKALDAFRRREEVPAPERAEVERLIGNISNLISLKTSSGDRRLSTLLAEVINCLAAQALSPLQGISQQLSDPLNYPNMPAAAQLLRQAVTTRQPIVVIGSNRTLAFIIAELLIKIFPTASISTCSPDLFSRQFSSETELSDVALLQTDNVVMAPPPEPALPPLALVLDAAAYAELEKQATPIESLIYLGIDLPLSLRKQPVPAAALTDEADPGSAPDLNNQVPVVNCQLALNPYEVLRAERGLEPAVTALVFKLCQAATSLGFAPFMPDYTAVDIETTDLDIETNDIVELAAVRVRNGLPVAHYETLIKPKRPVAPDAQKIHGLTDEQLSRAPEFNDVILNFLNFIGDDVLVAHNGYRFDFPCINRRLRDSKRPPLVNRIFDTLPLAQRLYPGQGASIDALAARFSIETGQRHRAYDDTNCLVQIFEQLKRENDRRLRLAAHEAQLDIVALGILVEHGRLYEPNALLLKHGAPRIVASSSTILAKLKEDFPESYTSELYEALERLTDSSAATGVASKETFGLLTRFDEIVRRFDELPLDAAMAEFLDFTSLYQQQDGLERRDAVSLMTIYAAKGLEFRRVFIAGVEHNLIPSYYAVKSDDPEQISEQRRLLYVAMTRAKEELVLTCVANRDGYPQRHSAFLRELQLSFDFEATASQAN